MVHGLEILLRARIQILIESEQHTEIQNTNLFQIKLMPGQILQAFKFIGLCEFMDCSFGVHFYRFLT